MYKNEDYRTITIEDIKKNEKLFAYVDGKYRAVSHWRHEEGPMLIFFTEGDKIFVIDQGEVKETIPTKKYVPVNARNLEMPDLAWDSLGY